MFCCQTQLYNIYPILNIVQGVHLPFWRYPSSARVWWWIPQVPGLPMSNALGLQLLAGDITVFIIYCKCNMFALCNNKNGKLVIYSDIPKPKLSLLFNYSLEDLHPQPFFLRMTVQILGSHLNQMFAYDKDVQYLNEI